MISCKLILAHILYKCYSLFVTNTVLIIISLSFFFKHDYFVLRRGIDSRKRSSCIINVLLRCNEIVVVFIIACESKITLIFRLLLEWIILTVPSSPQMGVPSDPSVEKDGTLLSYLLRALFQ